MHDLLDEEITTSLMKELGDTSTEAALFLNSAATVAEATGMVDMEDAVAIVDTVHTVDTMEAVEPKTAKKVNEPSAKLTAILQMHAESRNALRR